MTSHLEIATKTLLKPAGLASSDLERVLNSILSHRIDYTDLYFQSSHSESWMLEDGIIKDAAYSIERGVGVRAVSQEKTGFAYSADLTLPFLMNAANAAKNIVKSGKSGSIEVAKEVNGNNLYQPENPLNSFSEKEKVAILKHAEQVARKEDTHIAQVIVSLSGLYEIILIYASDGTLAADVRPLVRLNVSVIAEDKTRREQGFYGGGGRATYSELFNFNVAAEYAKEAVRVALVNLKAKAAPAGQMPVILGAGWSGVLLHEAIGHGLEGDFNRKGSSAFAGKMGKRVASSLCTIVDDGRLPGRRGSLNVDDEGVPTQKTVLIEDGILKGYMQDKLNARLMNMPVTGNGRRESYAHLPLPRMTNTYMLSGNHAKEEMIASVDKGLYAVNFAGGQVDITSGNFVFTTSEAYMIEKGKVTYPVKAATLIGSGPDVLTKVSMVGNKLKLDSGIGICGKEGQSIPVGVGQPMLKVDKLTVGGEEI